MQTLKAVAFDYGKVLSLPPTQEQWHKLSTRFGKPTQEFQQIYWGLNREELDRGVLGNLAYWKKSEPIAALPSAMRKPNG